MEPLRAIGCSLWPSPCLLLPHSPFPLSLIFWTNSARYEHPSSDEERRIVLRTMAHLIDDKTVAKMGHPIVWCC